MDGRRFLGPRAPTARSSRRTAIRALAAGVLASFFARAGTARAARDKVEICHQTGSATNPLVLIEVSRADLPSHQAHGDITPDFNTDAQNCGTCGHACNTSAGETCKAGQCGVVCNPEIDDCQPAGDD